MGLKTPLYLDADTLSALAEYNCIEVSTIQEVVETHRKIREAGLKAAASSLGAHFSRTRGVETQRSYSVTPGQKAAVRRTIDRLHEEDALLTFAPGEREPEKDDALELEGNLVLTPTSMVGKVFYYLHAYLGQDDSAMDALARSAVLPDESVMALLKDAYFSADLPPVPLLMELQNPRFESRVFVSLRHSGFVDVAEASHIAGSHRVLGQVSDLVDGDEDGYLSAERWLLHGWDPLMVRLMMAQMTGTVQTLVAQLGLDLPASDVQEYIQGPAVVLDAVAVY
ncbi:hypothetical protein [Micrococcus terreus]|uniref:hypothetical protein n=1 Tax=Micrococcus terreus TaxID=574650 RepID=UPI0023F7D2A5|nr:hypothetical protein [Micrococcus terreus]